MRVDAFQYKLPAELIAQHPAAERALARLMVLPRGGGAPAHRTVADFPELLPSGALVVVNDTRVIPARLLGRKRNTGGRVEVFLVRHIGDRDIDVGANQIRRAQVWRALGKAAKHLKVGTDIGVLRRGAEEESDVFLMVRLLGRADDDGLWEVALWT
ncbi:MAG TPA: S-adenosylmethionine:tRNA ribosyltransferase-isomerase, partial [Polyangiaceae bacterium]|nr:S-adenosylmethionine:tRNA ribosyltransferase-isomerase [Polyangiaceae bacterium]